MLASSREVTIARPILAQLHGRALDGVYGVDDAAEGIRLNNGPEMISHAFTEWAAALARHLPCYDS